MGEDESNKQKIEAKNGLENYYYSMRNTLSEEKLKDKFEGDDKDKIEKALQETLDWRPEPDGGEGRVRREAEGAGGRREPDHDEGVPVGGRRQHAGHGWHGWRAAADERWPDRRGGGLSMGDATRNRGGMIDLPFHVIRGGQ